MRSCWGSTTVSTPGLVAEFRAHCGGRGPRLGDSGGSRRPQQDWCDPGSQAGPARGRRRPLIYASDRLLRRDRAIVTTCKEKRFLVVFLRVENRPWANFAGIFFNFDVNGKKKSVP